MKQPGNDADHGAEFGYDDSSLRSAEGRDAVNEALLSGVEALDHARRLLLLRLVAAMHDDAYRRDGAASLTTWLQRLAGVTRAEALRLVRQASLLRRLDDFGNLYFANLITTNHLEALASVATERRQTTFDEFGQQLTEAALELGAEDFAKVCAYWAEQADEHTATPAGGKTHHRLTINPSLFGESDISGHLDAATTAVLTKAIGELSTPDPADSPYQRSLKERRADALGDLALHFLNQPPTSKTATSPSRAKPTAAVIIGWETFVDLKASEPYDQSSELAPTVDLQLIRRELIDSGPIPARVAALMTCDANIRRLVLDPAGQPLNVGRPTPTVSAAQRTALAVRDGGCVFPACDRPVAWTDAHHLHHRSDDGLTDLDNLVLLCRHHHRLVHDPGWHIERNPNDGRVRVTRTEDGRIYERDVDGKVMIYRPQVRVGGAPPG
jgi:hypothetical protein